ncbi:Centrosomal protein of 162 kDa [Takifugu flavidus]|uniref:Centrosomal protein of 162 kDa n=1 Tax=Takifugu flavidus TaxID=433684 RepID=A0A5C6PNF4_9TELE|nr:Centrosomal protein of 162 kDa [Takifugu flavidus]
MTVFDWHQEVIDRSWPTFESDKQSQVECWRRVAEDQRRQLDAFRQELDSILDILRYLQREGVVLSFPAPSTPHPHTPLNKPTCSLLSLCCE